MDEVKTYTDEEIKDMDDTEYCSLVRTEIKGAYGAIDAGHQMAVVTTVNKLQHWQKIRYVETTWDRIKKKVSSWLK